MPNKYNREGSHAKGNKRRTHWSSIAFGNLSNVLKIKDYPTAKKQLRTVQLPNAFISSTNPKP